MLLSVRGTATLGWSTLESATVATPLAVPWLQRKTVGTSAWETLRNGAEGVIVSASTASIRLPFRLRRLL